MTIDKIGPMSNVNTKIGTGAMGKVERVYLVDDVTLVKKTSLTRSDNPYLENEYKTLKCIQGKVGAVPVVYEDFPAKSAYDLYSFTMEDLGDYTSLQSSGTVESLDTMQKLFVVLEVSRALAAANENGIVYNDVNLQNIMFNKKTGQIKLVDWANAEVLEEKNSIKDVKQFVDMFSSLFGHIDFVPPKLKEWGGNLEKYGSPNEAWEKLHENWKDILYQEPKTEKEREEFMPYLLGKK